MKKMKQIALCLAGFFAIPAGVTARQEIKIDAFYSCSYNGKPLSDHMHGFKGKDPGRDFVEYIVEEAGYEPKMEVRAANVPQAAAVVYGNKRYLLYNPAFIPSVNKEVKTDWAAVSLLAHMIGHHLLSHPLDGSEARTGTELEADEFAGFILRKMGASLAESQAYLKQHRNNTPEVYPDNQSRLKAMEEGWNNGDSFIRNNGKTRDRNLLLPALMKEEIVKDTLDKTTPDSLDLYKEVFFYETPRDIYHLTSELKLVKSDANGSRVMGRMARSNKEPYPYMIYDKYFQFFYIINNGIIINRKGKKVGFMRSREE